MSLHIQRKACIFSEKDSSEEFNTKKQCIEIAKYHIDKSHKL